VGATNGDSGDPDALSGATETAASLTHPALYGAQIVRAPVTCAANRMSVNVSVLAFVMVMVMVFVFVNLLGRASASGAHQ
jgi:hypothetical protein